MATDYCNFTEKDLDSWAQSTLRHFAADPTTIPPGGEAFIRDRGGKNSVPGLTLRLRLRKERGSGQYTTTDPHMGFYIVRRIDGRKRTLMIGDRAVFSAEMARAAATKEQRELAKGIDRREERRKEEATAKARGVTYREALETFLEGADVAPRTKDKYRLSLTTTFRDVADKPLVEVFTPQEVQKRHTARSLESPSRADQDFRVLRLVWNWAREAYRDPDGEPLLGPNPVPLALNKTKAAGATKARWNHVPRRQTIIPEERLGDWFKALYAARADAPALRIMVPACDLLEALVLTGLRFGELASLTWERVDMALGTLSIPGPVSKNRKPMVRTLTRRLRALLEARRKEEALGSLLVFPGRKEGATIADPPRALLDLIAGQTGLRIVPHDLRRVFASAALRAGVPQEVLKRLLNHETGIQEVTSGYQVLDLGYLRQQSQAVEDAILGAAGLLPAKATTDHEVLALLAGMTADQRARLLSRLAAEQPQEVAHA